MKRILEIIMLCLVLSGCNNTNRSMKDNYISQSESKKVDTLKAYKDEVKEINNSAVHSWNEELSYDEVAYQLKSVTCTQSLENHNMNEVNYLTENIDAKGNLTGTDWFIWLNLTIRNDGKKETEVLVNSSGFASIEKDNQVIEAGGEAVYIEPRQSEDPEKYFHCILKPGESKELELGYIINENGIEGKLCYCIGFLGSEIDSSDNKFLDIEDFWNAK